MAAMMISPFSTATPDNVMNPIPALIDSGMSRRSSEPHSYGLYRRAYRALLLGADKRSAAEFSFYLAIPTMTGAFSYDLYKNWAQMNGSNTLIVGAGFAVSFVCGWFVVRTLLEYVSRHGFPLFAW